MVAEEKKQDVVASSRTIYPFRKNLKLLMTLLSYEYVVEHTVRKLNTYAYASVRT